jgi:diaminopimelate epimerase
MTTLTLAKHHGLGNDFLVLLDLDGTMPIDAVLARAVCDRHRGIGADGLIRVTRPAGWSGGSGPRAGGSDPRAGGSGISQASAPPPAPAPARAPVPVPVSNGGTAAPTGARADEAVLAFELRNADGSPAEMSGNGMRCLGQAALDAGLVTLGEPFVVATPVGPRTVTVRPGVGRADVWSSVEMGRALVTVGGGEPCNVGHGQLHVNLGNPHLVVLGPDPASVRVAELGPALEASVTGGQNVEFVALGPGPDEITMRVWERGVGETQACGTGACAAAVAFHHWGRVGRSVTVHQPGGPLAVEIGSDGYVRLSGPSELIATCEVSAALLHGWHAGR